MADIIKSRRDLDKIGLADKGIVGSSWRPDMDFFKSQNMPALRSAYPILEVSDKTCYMDSSCGCHGSKESI